jgi:hypothetical protein
MNTMKSETWDDRSIFSQEKMCNNPGSSILTTNKLDMKGDMTQSSFTYSMIREH